MSLEVTVHDAQTRILRELLFHPTAGYAELQKPSGLDSDHFNFHIVQLINKGLVEKQARGVYKLTPRGKEYANKLDTDSNTIERQPKVSVILVIWQDKTKSKLLMQERLKNPYFGFWGYPTGKMRWGETILAAAARELLEETGLIADFMYHGIYHEHAYRDSSDELMEDKLFIVTSTVQTTGKLVDGEGCRNRWVSLDEIRKPEPGEFDKSFPGFETVQAMVNGKIVLSENEQRYGVAEF